MAEPDYRNAAIEDRPTLDDVLQWYVAEEEHPKTKRARYWMFEFPYYRQEIAEFTASWMCMELFEGRQITAAVEKDEILLLHTAKVDQLLREHGH